MVWSYSLFTVYFTRSHDSSLPNAVELQEGITQGRLIWSFWRVHCPCKIVPSMLVQLLPGPGEAARDLYPYSPFYICFFFSLLVPLSILKFIFSYFYFLIENTFNHSNSKEIKRYTIKISLHPCPQPPSSQTPKQTMLLCYHLFACTS